MSKPGKIAATALSAPTISTQWFEEPDLTFANGRTHVDPQIGIPLYGPKSLGTPRHKNQIHVGFIGTAESVDAARKLYQRFQKGVAGDDLHVPFPGCTVELGYKSELVFDDTMTELLSRHETQRLVGLSDQRTRFETCLSFLESKLALLTQKDHPLDYVVVAPSAEVVKLCRTADYRDPKLGLVHRDLRRAFKALAMKHQKPTQLILDSTTGLAPTKQSDHDAVIAWNIFTGMYFKVDGLPWGPALLPPSTCFIGITFFRPYLEKADIRTSIAQAFDENGDGLVLRGHNFQWNEEKDGKSPHLSSDKAEELVRLVLQRYESERKQPPRRVVIHKSSQFEPEERAGFEKALENIKEFDLVALAPTSDVRLIRAGKYPPLRGTCFSVGEVSYMYTSGYLTSRGYYPHGHVPSPLQITDHVGDTSKENLLREVLTLTKMNWNSANMAGLLPVTLRFSRLVGDIMREIPQDQEPNPKYKFYI